MLFPLAQQGKIQIHLPLAQQHPPAGQVLLKDLLSLFLSFSNQWEGRPCMMISQPQTNSIDDQCRYLPISIPRPNSCAVSHYFASRDNSMTSSCGLLPVTRNGCDPRGKANSQTPGSCCPSATTLWPASWLFFPSFSLLQLELTPVLNSDTSIPRFDKLCFFSGASSSPSYRIRHFLGTNFTLHSCITLCASIIASHDSVQPLWCHCYCFTTLTKLPQILSALVQ